MTQLRTETDFTLAAVGESLHPNQKPRKMNNEERQHSPHWLKQEQPPTLKPTQAYNSAH